MVGIDGSPPPPMELGEPGSDDFTGFEVDMLKAVADRFGGEPRRSPRRPDQRVGSSRRAASGVRVRDEEAPRRHVRVPSPRSPEPHEPRDATP
jgi:ABC-type amino acid transport substrate-binding protein